MMREIFFCPPEELARFQERLTRNAADAQAGSTEILLLLNAGDIQAQLRGTDSSHVSSRTGADDNEIVLFLFHVKLRAESALDPQAAPGLAGERSPLHGRRPCGGHK